VKRSPRCNRRGRWLQSSPFASAPLQPTSYGDVHGSPDRARSRSLFPDHEVAQAAHEPAMPETFIPAGAERARDARPEDAEVRRLPMPAQNEIRQASRRSRRGATAKDPMSLCSASPCRPRPSRRRDEPRSRPRLGSGDVADAAAAGAKATTPVAQQIAATNRYRNMARRPDRRGWTLTVARHLLLRRHRATIIWTSRLSCAGRPTEFVTILTTERSRLSQPGPLFFDFQRPQHPRQATDPK